MLVFLTPYLLRSIPLFGKGVLGCANELFVLILLCIAYYYWTKGFLTAKSRDDKVILVRIMYFLSTLSVVLGLVMLATILLSHLR